jgi:hypothetical protein
MLENNFDNMTAIKKTMRENIQILNIVNIFLGTDSLNIK